MLGSTTWLIDSWGIWSCRNKEFAASFSLSLLPLQGTPHAIRVGRQQCQSPLSQMPPSLEVIQLSWEARVGKVAGLNCSIIHLPGLGIKVHDQRSWNPEIYTPGLRWPPVPSLRYPGAWPAILETRNLSIWAEVSRCTSASVPRATTGDPGIQRSSYLGSNI